MTIAFEDRRIGLQAERRAPIVRILFIQIALSDQVLPEDFSVKIKSTS